MKKQKKMISTIAMILTFTFVISSMLTAAAPPPPTPLGPSPVRPGAVRVLDFYNGVNLPYINDFSNPATLEDFDLHDNNPHYDIPGTRLGNVSIANGGLIIQRTAAHHDMAVALGSGTNGNRVGLYFPPVSTGVVTAEIRFRIPVKAMNSNANFLLLMHAPHATYPLYVSNGPVFNMTQADRIFLPAEWHTGEGQRDVINPLVLDTVHNLRMSIDMGANPRTVSWYLDGQHIDTHGGNGRLQDAYSIVGFRVNQNGNGAAQAGADMTIVIEDLAIFMGTERPAAAPAAPAPPAAPPAAPGAPAAPAAQQQAPRAPQTFDPIALIAVAALVSATGIIIAKRRKASKI